MALTERPLKRESKSAPEEVEYDQDPELDLPLYYEEDDLEGDKSFQPKSKAKKPTGSKKLKTNNGTAIKKGSSVGSGSTTSVVGQGNKVPVNNRKTYDWLAPSSVSASHSGPAGRSSDGAPGSDVEGNTSVQGVSVDDTGVEGSKVLLPAKKKPKKKVVDGDAAVKPKAPKKETKKGPRK